MVCYVAGQHNTHGRSVRSVSLAPYRQAGLPPYRQAGLPPAARERAAEGRQQ